MRVTNHAKQRFVLLLAINNPLSIKNFVAAVLAISLRKHDELNVVWITL